MRDHLHFKKANGYHDAEDNYYRCTFPLRFTSTGCNFSTCNVLDSCRDDIAKLYEAFE